LVPTNVSSWLSRLAGAFAAAGWLSPDFVSSGCAAVRQNLQRRFAALGERVHLLGYAVFEDAEIARFEPRYVPPFTVGHLEAQHHHIHFDFEGRAGPFLRTDPHRSGNSEKYG
jgi:hypothetical protein